MLAKPLRPKRRHPDFLHVRPGLIDLREGSGRAYLSAFSGNLTPNHHLEMYGAVIVGGDLIVNGDLIGYDFYCFGKVLVTGNIDVRNLYAGGPVRADGDLNAEFPAAGWAASDIADAAFQDIDDPDHVMRTFDPDSPDHSHVLDVLALEKGRRSAADSHPDCLWAGSLNAEHIEIFGHARIEGSFVVDRGEVHGNLHAEQVGTDRSLHVRGAIECRQDLEAFGKITAASVCCGGSLEGGSNGIQADGDISVRGSIRLDGSLSCGGSLQSGRSIQARGRIDAGAFVKAGEYIVAREGITTGEDYGILAALCLPRSRWQDEGYVSAPRRPKNILSGKFAKLELVDSTGT